MVQQEDGSLDFVKEMEKFSWQSHCRDSDVFTSCRYGDQLEKISRVTYTKVRKLLRLLAERHGFDPKMFGTHSFRIGGATALASGNVNIDMIQRLGGWKSNITPMQYTQPSSGAFGVAHSVLMNEDSYTEKDLVLHVKTKLKRANDVEVLTKKKVQQLNNCRGNTVLSNFLPKFECIQEDEDKEE